MQGEWYEVEMRRPPNGDWKKVFRQFMTKAHADGFAKALNLMEQVDTRVLHVTPRGREVVDG